MNAILRRSRHNESEPFESVLNGEAVVCDPSGVLFVPDHDLLVVSDLHLEKGAAFARRGMMMPPYDTAATLALLAQAFDHYDPKRVVCLGDSFHDRHGAAFMPAPFRERLAALMSGRDWTWILGNHDPEPPALIGGMSTEECGFGALVFRHEPSAAHRAGEVAGHLHPSARIAKAGRSVRGACFATDGERMIMPSFGVTTGGLNVLDPAVAGLFKHGAAQASVIGTARIYPVCFSKLSRG